uniref:Eukaryotic translation initiation factor 4 gamma 1 n=1 Tax=Cacopsylla melanoneura TaxID=428564 RepID=A0A8D8VKD1_9HEMI
MVGGGGKKKGKQQNQQQVNNNNNKANNAAPASAPIVNKENQVPVVTAADPETNNKPVVDLASIVKGGQNNINNKPDSNVLLDDTTHSTTETERVVVNNVANNTGSNMETPTVSAAELHTPPDSAPASSIFNNLDLDKIPEFTPSFTATPPTSKPASAAPAPTWNINANIFSPASQPTQPVAQHVSQVPQSGYGGAPVQYPQPAPLMPGPPMYPMPNQYSQQILYKGSAPFFMPYVAGPQASSPAAPQPNKHIMNRGANSFDPNSGYPVDVIHGLPQAHKPGETIQIRLDDNRKGTGIKPGGGYGIPGYQPPLIPHLPQQQYQPPPLMNNLPQQVHQKVMLEPVNVSAANLSDHTNSYTAVVQTAPPLLPLQPQQPPHTPQQQASNKPSHPPQQQQQKRPSPPPPTPAVEPPTPTPAPAPVTQVKPVAEIKIKSVMKVDEEETEEVTTSSTPVAAASASDEKTLSEALDKVSLDEPPPPTSTRKKESSPPQQVTLLSKKGSSSTPSPQPTSTPTPAAPNPTPPSSNAVDEKQSAGAKESKDKSARDSSKSATAAPVEKKAAGEEKQQKQQQSKEVKASSPVVEEPSSTPAPPLSNNKESTKPAAASNKKQAAGSKAASEEKESPAAAPAPTTPAPAPSTEKKEAKPAPVPAAAGVKPVTASPAAFDFKSMTNLGQVSVNTETREQFRNSLKTKGSRQTPLGVDDESVSSDPNRKKYSRNQLLELQNTPESSKMPDSYNKSLDIFHLGSGGGGGGAGSGGGGGGGRSSSSTFSNMSSFGVPGDRGYMHRGSQSTYGSKDKGDFQPMIIHSVSLREEVKLKTTENAWKASALKKDPNERVVIDARSFLNKLSPENFESILSKFVQLKLNNDNIGKIIDLITFKAVWEPKFSEVYAKFISELDTLDKKNNPPQKPTQGQPQPDPKQADPAAKQRFDIRGLLLKKFQAEFAEIVKTDKEARLKSEALKQIADAKEREEARQQYEDEERLNRKKSVGMMTFIGELFKLRMLHPKVLHSCFEQLLQKPRDVENLECLTKLIMSTGKSVEELNRANGPYSKTSKDKWNEVIPQVRKLVDPGNKNPLPSRIRFMILDVLDLKDRGWIPRMAENKPKTMAQIEKDIEQDAIRKNMQLRDDDNRMMGGMNKPTPGKRPQPASSNPQTPVSTASQKITVDVSKFHHIKQEDLELSLRPSFGSGGFGSFGGGFGAGMGAGAGAGFKSATKTASSSSSMRGRPGAAGGLPPPITQQNSFSVLSGMMGPESSAPQSKPTPPGKTQPGTPRGGASTPSKSKQSPASTPTTPAAPAKQAAPAAPAWISRNDNVEFEKKLATLGADQFEDKYSLEDQYMEFLQFGEHFTDQQDIKGTNNQYKEEVTDLMGKCLNRLHEPLLSWTRLEAQYHRLVEKMEVEVNSLGADKFDPRGLTRSLLIFLLQRRPVEQNFVTAFLISIIEKSKKWGGSTLHLLKDFVVYCTKSDIRDDFPNVVNVLGEVLGYLIVFGSLTLDDYRKHLLMKYVEDVSTKVFIHMVHSIARLQGAGPILFSSLPSLESIQSFLSPVTYRKYSSFTSFDPLPSDQVRAKLVDSHSLGWLLDRSVQLPAGHSLLVNTSRAGPDELALVNLCLHYYVAHSSQAAAGSSPVSEYLSLNFGTPCSNKDLWFALTQKIAYESLDPSGTSSAPNEDGADMNYKLNEARFRTLFQRLVTSHLATMETLDQVLPCLFALLDINLHMQLPMGLLQSQFVIVKEMLLETKVDLSLINAQFTRFSADKTSYHEPASKLAKPVSTDIVIQESGYSKTSALLALANFFKEIEDEEADVSGDEESGGEESGKK